MTLHNEKRNLKEIAKAFENQKVVLNTEHDVFALLGKNSDEVGKTVDGLSNERVLGKYRLLHHALDQSQTVNPQKAVKSALNLVKDVLDGQKVTSLKNDIETLLQQPIGKHIGAIESLNTEDNRDLGAKTEQKLRVIGVRSQKQWDAIVSDDTSSALLVKIFQNAGFGNSACTQLQKAIDWRKNKLGGISHGIDIATISDENKQKIHEAIIEDSDFKDALKNGLLDEEEKHINPFLKGNQEKHFFKDTLWEAYQDFLEALQVKNKNKLDDITYKTHGADFLQSSHFDTWRKNKVHKNIKRGARYTNPKKITHPGGIVQNGGEIDFKYDSKKNEITVVTPDSKSLLDFEKRTHFDDDAIKETTVEAKASYVVVEKGGEKKPYPLSSPIPLSKMVGAEKISVNYAVEGTLGYKDENLKEMISYEIPRETIILEKNQKALNDLLATVLPSGPINGDFNDEKNVEGGKPINSEPLKITGLTQDVVIDRLNNAEISFNGKDFYPRGSAQLKDRLIKDGESIYLQVVSGPNPKDTRTGSVTINGKELSFSVETKDVAVTPVIFSEPHASRLDGNTETKYDFAGTGPINKTGGTITITDGGGGIVRTETNLQTNGTGEWKRNIDMDGLPTGSYTVTVTIDGQTQPRTIQYVEKTAAAVTVTPVIFSEPHASRLDGNTETKYDFAGTGPINKTGGTITITDGGGGIVRTETNLQTNGTGEWKRNIDMDGLPTGSYTVTVTIDGQTQPRTIQYVEKTAAAVTVTPVIFSEPHASRLDGNTETKYDFAGTGPINKTGGTITITDGGGGIVRTETNLQTNGTGEWKRNIDMDGLPTGSYTVTVTIDGQTQPRTIQYVEKTAAAVTVTPVIFSEPHASRLDGNTETKYDFAGTGPINKTGGTITITDGGGGIVRTETNLQTNGTGEWKRNIDMDGLPTGSYTVTVTIDGQTQPRTIQYVEKTATAVTVTPVIFSEPHASRLDGNTETKYDFAGTGPINKTGGTITITDGGGGIVRTETNLQTNGTGEWKRNIDMDGLPTGSYTVTVTIDGQTQPRTIQYVEKTAALPDYPSFTSPGHNVFGKSPVTLKGKLNTGKYVQVQRWDGAAWVDMGGRLTPDATSKEWEFPVGRLAVGEHRWRAVPCLDDGTLVPTRATEHTFEVGYLRMENFANPDRDTINLRVHGESQKNVIYTLSKKDDKGRNKHRDIPLILNSAREDITLNNLGLSHGDWKIEIKQDDSSGAPQILEHNFNVASAPTVVNPLALNQRRQILTGTGEPGEAVDVKIKIGGNPEIIPPNIKTDAAGNRSVQLDDLVTGPCIIEATCAGNTIRQIHNLEIPNRRPILNHGDIVVNEGHSMFDVSGYLPNECLDCNRVLIKDKDGNTIKTLDLGNRTRGGAIRDVGRNITDFGRNRRRNNSFETDLSIADLGIELGKSAPLTIVPVGINNKEYKDEAVTFVVEHREDIRQRRATALKPGGIVKTSSVDFEGKAPGAKRVRLWKEGIGVGHGFLRGKSEVEEIDVVDGKWSANKTILKDGNQSWRVAAVDDNGNLGPSSPINFRMQLPENEGKLPWWKKALPRNWFGKGKKGAGKEGGDKEGGKGGEEGGDKSDESGTKKKGLFGTLGDIVNGNFGALNWLHKNADPTKTGSGRSMGRFYGGMIDGKNDVTDELSGKNKKAA